MRDRILLTGLIAVVVVFIVALVTVALMMIHAVANNDWTQATFWLLLLIGIGGGAAAR